MTGRRDAAGRERARRLDMRSARIDAAPRRRLKKRDAAQASGRQASRIGGPRDARAIGFANQHFCRRARWSKPLANAPAMRGLSFQENGGPKAAA